MSFCVDKCFHYPKGDGAVKAYWNLTTRAAMGPSIIVSSPSLSSAQAERGSLRPAASVTHGWFDEASVPCGAALSRMGLYGNGASPALL